MQQGGRGGWQEWGRVYPAMTLSGHEAGWLLLMRASTVGVRCIGVSGGAGQLESLISLVD